MNSERWCKQSHDTSKPCHGLRRRLAGRWIRRAASALLAGLLFAPAAAQPGDESEEVVALPPLIVTASQLQWRYLTLPGIEVISVLPDSVTKDIVRRHYRLEQLLRAFVPQPFRFSSSVSDTYILFNEQTQRMRSEEIVAEMLRKAPAPAGGGRNPRERRRRAVRVQFLPNMRLWDLDAMSVFVIVSDNAARQIDFSFHVGRVAYLLDRRVPALPRWYVTGTLELYQTAQFGDDFIAVDPAQWKLPAATEAIRNDPNTPRLLLPVGEMLAGPPRAAPEGGPDELSEVWRVQCGLFVRWALVHDGGARREALWDFVHRLETEPLTENLFRECFGLGFADVRDRLSDYLDMAVQGRARIAAPKPEDPPELSMRDATAAEIARIRGDWERMEIAYVRARHPELTSKYIEQALGTLRRAYDRGVRDAAFEAVLGLAEREAGNFDAALTHLEAAVADGCSRPRALLELAYLRYTKARSEAGEGRLPPDQLARVIELLLRACGVEPPVPNVYALLAEVWFREEVALTAEDFSVLDKGVGLFPQASPLVLRAIFLHLRAGHVEEATEMMEFGLRHANDPGMREAFEKLQRQMAAVRAAS